MNESNINDTLLVGLSGPFTSKPPIAALVKQTCLQNYHHISVEELAHYVSNEGYAFLPSLLKGGGTKDHYRQSQVFALDFDNKEGKPQASIDEVYQRASQYNLYPAFSYMTFRCDENKINKFRVVFVHEFPIFDKIIATTIYRIMLKVFPEADPACVEISRMFFGGKKLLKCNPEARFNLVQFIHSTYPVFDNNNHFSRNLKTTAKQGGIAVINNRFAIDYANRLSVFGLKSDSDNNIIKWIESPSEPIFYISYNNLRSDGSREVIELHQGKTSGPRRIRLSSLEGFHGCALLEDFLSGTHLFHEQLFMILLSLKYIGNGTKIFEDILDQYYDDGKVEDWNRQYRYIKDYNPMMCSEAVCPYYAKCTQFRSTSIYSKILHDTRINKLHEEEYVSLEEAQALLYENIESAYKCGGKGIHLIRAQTAMGKTSSCIEFIEEHPNIRVLYCCPLNHLKIEVANDMRRKGIDAVASPSVRKNSIIPEDIQKQYFELHQLGKHSEAKSLISDFVKEYKKEYPEAYSAIEELDGILEGIKSFNEHRVVVTTHALLVYTSEKVLKSFDIIIIDEDILYLQFMNNIKSIPLESVQALCNSSDSVLQQIANEMIKTKVGEYKRASFYERFSYFYEKRKPQYEGNLYEEDDENPEPDIDGNANDLPNACAYMLDNDNYFYYFCYSRLPDLKYIVLSATINEKLYRDYFKGKSIYTYNSSNVKYKGKLIQYTAHSLGRSDIKRHPDVFEKVNQIARDTEIIPISFKQCNENQVLNNFDMHFGNIVGTNIVKGKNIAIIGTPFKNEKAYKLIGCFLYGEKVSIERLSKRRIEYKNYSFNIMAYKDADLREIELYSIESELEQGIGRARLLRFDCTVYLFSAFPCEQAELHTERYLDDVTEVEKTDQK